MSDVHSKKLSVFLVDDRPENLGFLRDALEFDGHVVQTFLDGPSALTAIKENPPNMVLLDLEMPKMDGLAVLREIRSDERLSSLTVMILSAHPRSEVEKDCFAAGATDVLSKPIRLATLRKALQSACE